MVWGLFAAASNKDLESVASFILKFFVQHKRELFLIEEAITKEVQLTSMSHPIFSILTPMEAHSIVTASSTSLFRQNNFASKLLSIYCKRFGLAFVKLTLYDSVINICLAHQNNADWSCEVGDSSNLPSVVCHELTIGQ